MNAAEIRCTLREEKRKPEREPLFRSDFLYAFGKRSMDVVVSAAALVVLWPIFLLIGLAVMLDSPGAGPLFSQTRVGRDGNPFTMYKFRTMIPHAEERLEDLLCRNEMDGPAFKIRFDPRITRLGRFLRRSGIDELPQLWNVLRGDMSLVGPRPPLPREAAQYDGRMRKRLSVKPGITCYWQVTPSRNALSFEQWLELDLRYIRERSLRRDWQILLATFGAVLGMEGE